jgi:hypothetical protein
MPTSNHNHPALLTRMSLPSELSSHFSSLSATSSRMLFLTMKLPRPFGLFSPTQLQV